MKYEVTQQQYIDYLNCLPRAEQIKRVASDISGTTVTNRFVMSNTFTMSNGNSIKCNATIPPAPTPVTFYCDYNNNAVGNEAGDGQWKACNYLSWDDLNSVLLWSGLRPMTELEFEKVCRGPLYPVTGEYAWGTTSVTNATAVQSPGTNSESVTAATANNSQLAIGPLRVGCFANGTSSREQAGAAYYGAMNMSGNVLERVVNINNPGGSNYCDCYQYFEGFTGSGFRGGSFASGPNTLQTGDRSMSEAGTNTRLFDGGGRGVRTLQ
jgi:formylglycine-generating enzyme required for sulfatase activity